MLRLGFCQEYCFLEVLQKTLSSKKIVHDVIRTTFVSDSTLEEEVEVTWDLRNRCMRLA